MAKKTKKTQPKTTELVKKIMEKPSAPEALSERLKVLEKERWTLLRSPKKTPKSKARSAAIRKEEKTLAALIEVTDITLAGKYLGLTNLGASLKLPTNEKTLRNWVGQTEADYSYEMDPSGELNEWIKNLRQRDQFATLEIARELPFLVRIKA